jgi:DNA-directed RNA polymerase subunit M/transcription elongation factor TFIIS
MEDDVGQQEEEEEEIVDENEGDEEGSEELNIKIVKNTIIPQYTNLTLPRKVYPQVTEFEPYDVGTNASVNTNDEKKKNKKKTSDGTNKTKSTNINDFLLKLKSEVYADGKEYKSFRKECFEEEFNKQTKKTEIKEGDYVCPRCEQRYVSYTFMQLRSIDEPMDLVFTCHNSSCKHVGKNFKEYVSSKQKINNE